MKTGSKRDVCLPGENDSGEENKMTQRRMVTNKHIKILMQIIAAEMMMTGIEEQG